MAETKDFEKWINKLKSCFGENITIGGRVYTSEIKSKKNNEKIYATINELVNVGLVESDGFNTPPVYFRPTEDGITLIQAYYSLRRI